MTVTSVPTPEELLGRLNGDTTAALDHTGGIADYVTRHRPELLSDDETRGLRDQGVEALRTEALRVFNVWVGYSEEPERGHIERVERLLAEPPLYRIIGTAGTATATMAQMMDWRTAKPKIAEAANRFPLRQPVKLPGGQWKEKGWDAIVPAFMAAAWPVEAGEELTDRGLALAYVRDYLHAALPRTDDGKRSEAGLKVDSHAEGLRLAGFTASAVTQFAYYPAPYILGGRLHIQPTALLRWLVAVGERGLTRQKLASVLAAAGAKHKRVGSGVTVWHLPRGAL